MTTEASDAALVQGVRRGSREAAAALAERHLRGCRVVALAIVGEIAAAEDVCQDGFVYAMAHIDDCRDPARFGAWLRQIVRSQARNHLRAEKRDRVVPLASVAEPVGTASPARDAELAEIRERLLAALGTLPEDRREVVLLHDLEGWTHREIAERMALPPGTVRSHLHLARKALRVLLGGLGRGPDA